MFAPSGSEFEPSVVAPSKGAVRKPIVGVVGSNEEFAPIGSRATGEANSAERSTTAARQNHVQLALRRVRPVSLKIAPG